jgi:asparagine synthase (glutamine-hydrolysing)
MCGIVGFKGRREEVLDEMLKSIDHRGPDDFGTYESDVCSLGHVRLSIVDLSSQGHQPMIHENLKMVYNGEVYNFKEIRAELEQKGYDFESNTDSEVILKAYHCWGIEAVKKFIGMYAIAIYDENSSEVVLIRDRVGVKPLYYYHDNEDFIFASELKPIMKYKDDLEISQEGLQEYFQFGYISKNLSIFEKCHKLPAGHYGVYNLNSSEFTIKEYWSILPFFELPKFQKTEEQLVDELEAILIDAFKYRMVSDVPVGVFLSGGVDSSIVAAILQKHHGDIHTFTIGFSEEKYNEASYAKEVAEHLGTNHTEKILGAKEAKEILKEFVDIYDEPFADSSGIPTTMVCQVARDAGMKVVLSADGGDEIFCGYSRYWVTHSLGKKIFSIPKFVRKSLGFILRPMNIKKGKTTKGAKLGNKLSLLKEYITYSTWEEMYGSTIHNFRNHELEKLLGERLELNYKKNIIQNHSPMEKMMLWDYHHYMVDDILTKVDRATMSVSIEGREPLLDHRIAEFMAQVPFEYKYRDGDSKYLLKKVLERYIPKRMIERPKMGFGIPLNEWFDGELGTLFRKNLSKEKLLKHGLFNRNYVEHLLNVSEHKFLKNNNKLWFILVFQLWYSKYLDKSKKATFK